MIRHANDPEPVGLVTLAIEEVGRRMFLREEIASGTTADGREFHVTRILGGVAITVEIEGGGSYRIPLTPALDYALDLDAKRRAARETVTPEVDHG